MSARRVLQMAVGAVALALPAAAGAATSTVGSTASAHPGADVAPCGMARVIAQLDDVLPATGHVTAFHLTPTSFGQTETFLVLRPVPGTTATYVVDATTGPRNVPAGTADVTILPDRPLPVREGDVLGLWVANADDPVFNCLIQTGNPFDVRAVSTAATAPRLGDAYAADLGLLSGGLLNESATFDDTPDPPVSGDGTLATGVRFHLDATSLDYTTPGRRGGFHGTIDCVATAGNAATIVATDPRTGLRNQTMVLDGPDKLVNRRFDPDALDAAERTALGTCITPDVQRLGAAPPIASGTIAIGP